MCFPGQYTLSHPVIVIALYSINGNFLPTLLILVMRKVGILIISLASFNNVKQKAEIALNIWFNNVK